MMRIKNKDDEEKKDSKKDISKTSFKQMLLEIPKEEIDAYVPENENDVEGLDYITETNTRKSYVR